MKKILFFAIAALTYAGAANAQALIYNTTSLTPGAYPAKQAVTATSLVEIDGTGVSVSSTANGTALHKIKMSIGGTYMFQAKSTDWKAILGTTWSSTIAGSIFKFKASPATTDAVYKESTFNTTLDSDGESSLITGTAGDGTSKDFDLTITPTKDLASFSFEEVAIKFNENSLGAFTTSYANSVGCSSPFSVYVKPVAIPEWKGNAKTKNNEGDVTINNAAICLSNIATASAGIITINLKAANTEIGTRYVKATLTAATGAGTPPTFPATVFENPTTAADVTIDILKEGSAASVAASNPAAFIAGVYTFTVNEVSDDILNNADNAYTATTGLALNNVMPNSGTGANYKVVFTILPSPKPTLTTATKI